MSLTVAKRNSWMWVGLTLLLLGTAREALPQQKKASAPAFVEEMPGAKRLVDLSSFSNDLREGGTILLSTEKSSAEILAFYRQSMRRNGLVPGPETAAPKVTLLKGLSADGKRELRLEVNRPNGAATVFQLNYVVSKK